MVTKLHNPQWAIRAERVRSEYFDDHFAPIDELERQRRDKQKSKALTQSNYGIRTF